MKLQSFQLKSIIRSARVICKSVAKAFSAVGAAILPISWRHRRTSVKSVRVRSDSYPHPYGTL